MEIISSNYGEFLTIALRTFLYLSSKNTFNTSKKWQAWTICTITAPLLNKLKQVDFLSPNQKLLFERENFLSVISSSKIPNFYL